MRCEVIWSHKEEVHTINTLDELKYYCSEPKPVGALMLTGEWGCGKTYLLDNVLKKELEKSHVFLRVSLFGASSIDEVKNEVKCCWIYTLGESNEQISGITEKVKKFSGVAKTIANKGSEFLPEPFKSIASSILSLNAVDFVKVEPQMGDKKVVLIFDDLERANISTGDLLGCINDYCENSHINTIVVANEEKIKSNDSDKIVYNEIKEKIIQRTIHYKPDFASVVSNVVDDMDCSLEPYKELLEANKDEIEAIFSGLSIDGVSLDEFVSYKYSGQSREDIETEKQKVRDLLKQRPHNIRSLKCALQDFKRVFIQLDKKKINEKEKWLFTYLTYVLSFRAGLIPESTQCETLFSDEKISLLYPGFYNDRYIISGIKKWIRYGEWNQENIDIELDYIINRDKAITPEEKVRTNRLLDLDETDIQEGYPPFLEKAYAGEISLDDYVNMLWNCCLARNYNIQIPDIDWSRICIGIKHKIEELLQSGEDQPYHRMVIGENNKQYFLPEEWEAYEIISTFLDGNYLMFEKNRKVYLDLIQTDPMKAFAQTENKRIDRFDVEMADATVIGFEKASNRQKSSFINYFKGIWQSNICSQEYKLEYSKEGFPALKDRLEQFKDKCSQDSLYISEIHTTDFINVVSELIVAQKNKEKKAEEKAEIAEQKKVAEEALMTKEAKKAELERVLNQLMADGMSADEILEKLK